MPRQKIGLSALQHQAQAFLNPALNERTVSIKVRVQTKCVLQREALPEISYLTFYSPTFPFWEHMFYCT